jgi:hypothetical protein
VRAFHAPLLLAGLLALAGSSLAAQLLPSPEPAIWSGGLAVLDLHGSSLWSRIVVQSANGKVSRSILTPARCVSRDCLEGRLYVLTDEGARGVDRARGVLTDYLYRIYERPLRGEDWVETARWRTPVHGVSQVAKLANGNYFALATLAAFKVPGGYAPCGILESDAEGNLTAKGGVDFGLDRPLWREPLSPRGEPATNYPGLTVGYLTALVRTPGHLTLVLQDTGWIFVFSAKDGALQRKAHLFKGVDERALQEGTRFACAALGVQPRADGRILLATRVPEAVLAGPEGALAFPDVAWWVFDPDTGTVRPEAAPPGVATEVKTFIERWLWQWRPQEDGSPVRARQEPDEAWVEAAGQPCLGEVAIR